MAKLSTMLELYCPGSDPADVYRPEETIPDNPVVINTSPPPAEPHLLGRRELGDGMRSRR